MLTEKLLEEKFVELDEIIKVSIIFNINLNSLERDKPSSKI